MNRRLIYSLLSIVVLIQALAGCSSCSDNKNQVTKHFDNEAEVNPMVEEIDNIPDEAFFAELKDVDGNELKLVNLETGEELFYDFSSAKASGMVKGSITKGNTYSLFPDNSSKEVRILINTTELEGQWFYDMQQHRGMKFEAKGGLSSINTEDIAFRQWKLVNGKLYIYYVDLQMVAPDRHEYLVEEAEISHLSKEQLSLQFKGTTYNCQRQKGLIKFH